MSLFDLTDVISAINNSSALCGNSRIVTIDGPAGSGKTTLANEIATEFAKSKVEVSVVHLDELYEGWDDALGQKLFDRIEAWILTPIESNDRYSEFEIDIDAAERLEHINAIYNYEVQKDGIVLERGLLKYITEEGGSNGSIEYVSDNETKEATQYYRPQY